MVISKTLYERLMKEIPTVPPEIGVILGKKTNIIDYYYLDYGLAHSAECYVPNIDILNSVINDWARDGIQFVGFAHTHNNIPTLSSADKEYIFEILQAVKSYRKSLLFPVIIPQQHMVCFSASIQGKDLVVVDQSIEITNT